MTHELVEWLLREREDKDSDSRRRRQRRHIRQRASDLYIAASDGQLRLARTTHARHFYL